MAPFDSVKLTSVEIGDHAPNSNRRPSQLHAALSFTLASSIFFVACIGTSAADEGDVAPTSEIQAKFLLGKYKQFLSAAHERSYRYECDTRISTPTTPAKVTVTARGILRLSAEKSSLYYDQSSMASVIGIPGTRDQGRIECALQPVSAVRLASRTSAKDPTVKGFSAEVWTEDLEGRWTFELARHHLGLLLGYLPLQTGEKSIIAIAGTAGVAAISESGPGAVPLSGFLCRANDGELRVLFSASDKHALRYISYESTADQLSVGEISQIRLDVEGISSEFDFPIASTFRVTLSRSGGVQHRSGSVVGGVSLGQPDSQPDEVEPTVAESVFRITDSQQLSASKAPAFDLSDPIPNGTTVTLNGDRQTFYFWKNGKTLRISPDLESDIEAARFSNGPSAFRLIVLIGMNVVLFLSFFAIRAFRARKKS